MNTNKKILIGAISTAVVIGGVTIGFILSKSPEPADLSTIHTQASAETEKETLPETSAPETTVPQKETEAVRRVTADLATYTYENISIQYPVVSQMEDEEKQQKVNDLLKENALSVLKANQINEDQDTLKIKCQVVSVDRSRINAVYTGELSAKGAAHPSNLFYTNTVNLSQVQNMGMEDFADAYTMAGYVLSEDVSFSNLSQEQKNAVLEYRSSLDIETLTAVFDKADFPLDGDTWPESFSYEKQGSIYFSLPVPHSMGDYVIVVFDPSTK